VLESPQFQEMNMRVIGLIGALYMAAGASHAQAPASQASPSQPAPSATQTIQSVGTMSELMLDIIYPASDEIFYVNRDEKKKTEKDWIDLTHIALTLAESANILMADNRARDKDRWMKDARLLWEVGNKAFIAAKARDLRALEALNAELYEACQSCHVHYRPGYRRRL
jgi:hypothetical protein